MRAINQRGQTRRGLMGVITGALLIAGMMLVATPSADAAVNGIQGVIFNNGGRVEGVKIDLFTAAGDGSRGTYLRDIRTDRNGWYRLDVEDRCYIMTMVAPDGMTFTANGSRWLQRPVCTSNGQTQAFISATLTGGNNSGGDPDPAPAPTCTGEGNPIWDLYFQDDFNGNGSDLGSNWDTYDSAGNAGYGLRRPSAISKWNGNLSIKASMQNGKLVSGGLRHTAAQKYGRYEFRVRTDQDWSEGTSGVVLTWPTSDRHPWDGENNIYETLATPGDRHEFYTFIHEPEGTVHDQDYTVHRTSANQWHTMAMEWTPDKIVIIRDGQVVKTIRETSENLIPDNEHFLAIQLDGWKHSIDRPVWMQVDYVKVWSYEGKKTC